MNRIVLILPLVLLLVFTGRADAQGACPAFDQVDPADDPIGAFDDLLGQAAMGGGGCDSDLCRAIDSWEGTDASREKTEQAVRLLDQIRESALALPPDLPGVATLQRHLVEWQQLMARADILTLPTSVWAPANFVLFPNRRGEEVDFEQEFQQRCPDSVSQCQAVFETSACVYTHAVLQRRVLLEMLQEDREETVAYLHRLNNRWQTFNSGGRALFPWELGVNSVVHNRQFSQRGFVEPPRYQISLLHPSVALEYQDSSEGELDEALVLELLGFYRWRWGGDDAATMTRPFGVSAIASWTGADELGYGVMIHLPKNWSFGVTRREIAGKDETTYLLSVDLGKFLVDERKLREKLIGKLGEVRTR